MFIKTNIYLQLKKEKSSFAIYCLNSFSWVMCLKYPKLISLFSLEVKSEKATQKKKYFSFFKKILLNGKNLFLSPFLAGSEKIHSNQFQAV